MRTLFLLFGLSAASSTAFALGGASWFNAEYTFTNFSYKENAISQTGHLPGLRGELGFAPFGEIGFSVGGEYQDGNLDFTGTTVSGNSGNLISKVYIRDTRLMGHYFMGNMALSSGVAQREWYNNLIGNYRRRDTLNYIPAVFTFNADRFYLRVEMDFQMKGKTELRTSDLGAPAQDLTFERAGGTGFTAEVGHTAPTGSGFFYRIYLSYRRLIINDGGSQSDGVRTVTSGKSTSDLVQAGLGFGF